MSGLLPLLAFMLLLGGGPAPAACEPPLRCSCLESPSATSARSQADAVFLGTVVAMRETTIELEDGLGGIPARLVTLRVHAAWKGVPATQETVRITTGLGGGDCGYSFTASTTYLVYANGPPDELSTSICSRTAPARVAREDFEELGHPPVVLHQ